jgi:hypothetical protein
MNLRARLASTAMSAALAFVPLIASSAAQELSLKHGVYARGKACKDPPNAAILFWDGIGFSRAHSSRTSFASNGSDAAGFAFAISRDTTASTDTASRGQRSDFSQPC